MAAVTENAETSKTSTLFVYGTLIHPHILARVLAGTLARSADEDHTNLQQYQHLIVTPALLPGHEIRRVRGQEYPGLVSADAVSSDSDIPSTYVRGVIVEGLSNKELVALDEFEGDEYVRTTVGVIISATAEKVSNDVRSSWPRSKIGNILDAGLPAEEVQALISGSTSAATTEAQTYVWIADPSDLEAPDGERGPWEFSSFAASKSDRWTTGDWTNAGGPDGLNDQNEGAEGATISASATQSEISHGNTGFEAVQNTMNTTSGAEEVSSSLHSFSTLSLPPATDPWADTAPVGSPYSPSGSGAPIRSANPWSDDGNSARQIYTEGSSAWSWLRRETLPEGYPVELQGVEAPGYERFGKPSCRWWYHAEHKEGSRRYINFNHGALGSCPKPVMEAYQALSLKAEEVPDLFERRQVPQLLRELRQRVAKHLTCPPQTVVMLQTATTAANTVLRAFPWERGDCIIHLSTMYGAVLKICESLYDTHPYQPETIQVEVTYPLSHDATVKCFEDGIQQARESGRKVRMAIFDAISSQPGVLVPWERLVQVCKAHNIYSLVDAAHAFGQIPVNLNATEPDFWLSNAHKWGYAHRGCAVLHVPVRNQHLVHSSLATSWNFRSKAERASKPSVDPSDDFINQFSEMSSIDWSSILSLEAALTFREQKLGGEARIQSYTHSLALLGGLLVARILGTETLDTTPPSLVASMTSVRLPLVSRATGPDLSAWLGPKGGQEYIWNTLFNEYSTILRCCVHGQSIYARISAQIWLDLDDFEYLGRALKDVCQRINSGEAKLTSV